MGTTVGDQGRRGATASAAAARRCCAARLAAPGTNTVRMTPTCDAGGGTPGLPVPFRQAVRGQVALSQLVEESVGVDGGPPCAGGSTYGAAAPGVS